MAIRTFEAVDLKNCFELHHKHSRRFFNHDMRLLPTLLLPDNYPWILSRDMLYSLPMKPFIGPHFK